MARHLKASAPDLAGKECQGLLCQQFEANGRVVSEALVVHLKFEGSWHRAHLEPGSVFWRVSDSTPTEWEVAEGGWLYPLVDVGRRDCLIGLRLVDYKMSATDADARLEFRFERGRKVVVEHKANRTRLAVI